MLQATVQRFPGSSACHLRAFFLLSICAIRSSLFLPLLFPSEDGGQ